MSGFNWKFEHTIDDKGRLAIPSEVRQLLLDEDQRIFTVTKGLYSCLYAFPKRIWEKRIRENMPENLKNEDRYKRKQALSSWSINCTMDSQNRIKLPEELIKHASLIHSVTIAGVDDRLELWNTEAYQKHYSDFDFNQDDVINETLL